MCDEKKMCWQSAEQGELLVFQTLGVVEVDGVDLPKFFWESRRGDAGMCWGSWFHGWRRWIPPAKIAHGEAEGEGAAAQVTLGTVVRHRKHRLEGLGFTVTKPFISQAGPLLQTNPNEL
jgi:hypothetical protein